MGRNFDGTDDYVDIGSSGISVASSQGLTILAWVKTSDSYGPIVSFRNSTSEGPIFSLHVGDNGGATNAGHFLPIMRFDGSVGLVYFSTTSNIADNQWHYVGASYNPSMQKLLAVIDNTVYTISQTNTGAMTFSVDLAIGRESYWVRVTYSTGDKRYLSGIIANVLTYKREFSSNELLRYRDFPTLGNNLGRFYPLWGVTSPEADLSGNKVNGTVYGATAANHAPNCRWVSRKRETSLAVVEAVVGQPFWKRWGGVPFAKYNKGVW